MELGSLVGKKIEGAYLSENTFVIKINDGRSIYIEAKLLEEKPFLDIILNK